jgi:hypothetical protein
MSDDETTRPAAATLTSIDAVQVATRTSRIDALLPILGPDGGYRGNHVA